MKHQITLPQRVLNHLGRAFTKFTSTAHLLHKYNRQLARRSWRESFGAKVIWRNSRHAGSDCSFRIFTGRCAS